MKWFKERRITKLRIRLAALQAEYSEEVRVANVVMRVSPGILTQLVHDIAAITKELEILGYPTKGQP
jgi:hypothetical protein